MSGFRPGNHNEVRGVDLLFGRSALVADLRVKVVRLLVVIEGFGPLSQAVVGHAEIHQLERFDLAVARFACPCERLLEQEAG